jgi:hypothetical protein
MGRGLRKNWNGSTRKNAQNGTRIAIYIVCKDVNAGREIVVAIGDEKSHHKIAFREVAAAAINAVLTRYPNTS